MSGHSKWATTKHQKAVKDARRGKEFARLIKNIEVAARTGGGDPAGNPTLYDAIQKAKKTSVPNDNIERARKRGAGEEAGGADWQTITYEGYAPNGVAVLIECLTDNRNRAASEVRVAMTRNGGTMADPGSVSYLFSRKGVVTLEKNGLTEDDVLTAVLDAGAEDVNDLGDSFEVISEPTDLVAVRTALQDAGIDYDSAEASFQPSVSVPVDVDGARKVFKLVDALEDSDDVQNVYTNVDLSDEVLAALDEELISRTRAACPRRCAGCPASTARAGGARCRRRTPWRRRSTRWLRKRSGGASAGTVGVGAASAAARQRETPVTERRHVHVIRRDRVAGGPDRRDRAPERRRRGKRAARLHDHEPAGRQRVRDQRVELGRIQPAQHRCVGVGQVDDDRVEAAGRTVRGARSQRHRVVDHDVDPRVVQRAAVGVAHGGARQFDHRRVELHLHDLARCRAGAAVRGPPGRRRRRAPAPSVRHCRARGRPGFRCSGTRRGWRTAGRRRGTGACRCRAGSPRSPGRRVCR